MAGHGGWAAEEEQTSTLRTPVPPPSEQVAPDGFGDGTLARLAELLAARCSGRNTLGSDVEIRWRQRGRPLPPPWGGS